MAPLLGATKARGFIAVRWLLAGHETAEEEIVRPWARSKITGFSAVVHARLGEENQAKKQLAELESFDVDSAEFETRI